jgi:hypothetical protein
MARSLYEQNGQKKELKTIPIYSALFVGATQLALSANTSRVIYRQKWLMMSEHGRNVALSFYI